MKITVHHANHSVRKVQHDYVLCPILCKPFRLRAAATPRINEYFSIERIGTTERISHSMRYPINLEVCEVEIIPFITKFIHCSGWNKIYKTRNTIYYWITISIFRCQFAGNDISLRIEFSINEM